MRSAAHSAHAMAPKTRLLCVVLRQVRGGGGKTLETVVGAPPPASFSRNPPVGCFSPPAPSIAPCCACGHGLARAEPLSSASAQGILNNPYSAFATAAFPAFMVPPMAVVNDGRRRTLLIVNEARRALKKLDGRFLPAPSTSKGDHSFAAADTPRPCHTQGYNPTDTYPCPVTAGSRVCSSTYPAQPLLLTLNISAWRVPSSSTLAHVSASEFQFGEVAGLVVGAPSPDTAPDIELPFSPTADIYSFQRPILTSGVFYDSLTLLLEPYRRARALAAALAPSAPSACTSSGLSCAD